jgi:hypothetical protein
MVISQFVNPALVVGLASLDAKLIPCSVITTEPVDTAFVIPAATNNWDESNE